MAEMVGAELGLEPVCGHTLGAGHDPGIGDDDIERLARGVQPVGAGADAVQRCEVELLQREARNMRRCVASLAQISRRTDELGAVSDENPRRLDAEPGRNAGDQDTSICSHD